MGFALGFGQFYKFRDLVEFVTSMLATAYNLPQLIFIIVTVPYLPMLTHAVVYFWASICLANCCILWYDCSRLQDISRCHVDNGQDAPAESEPLVQPPPVQSTVNAENGSEQSDLTDTSDHDDAMR